MQNLDIYLSLEDNGKLIAVDETIYDTPEFDDVEDVEIDFSHHVSIEYLCDHNGVLFNDSIIFHNDLCLIDGYINHNESTFVVYKDGVFTYNKLLVPTLEHLNKNGKYMIENQLFYHNGNFYHGEKDSTEADIFSNSKSVDISALWGVQGTQTLSYQKRLFSFCKLQECLLNLQKQILSSNKSCDICEIDNQLRYKRDFLFSTIYVLNYLKQQDNFSEAQRILDNFSSCSFAVCEESEFKNNCGCGKIVY